MSSSARPRDRRLTAVCALVVFALIASACGVEQAATFEDLPRQEIAELLRKRSEALSAGDGEGYLAPLSGAAREVEEPIARGAVAVPIEDVRLTMDEVDIGPQGNTASDARIDFTYRYEGLPEDNVFFFRLLYDFAKVDGQWQVTSSTPDEDKIFLPIWATGDVEVAESEHFLALHRPGMRNVDRILAEAEEARTELVAQLTLETDDRHLLWLAEDGLELGEFLGADDEEYGAIAVAIYLFTGFYGLSEVPDDRFLIANVELTFGGQADEFVELDRQEAGHGHDHGHGEDGPGHDDPEFYDRITPRQVFRHELAHLALSRFTRETTPAWIVEGGAMMLSGESRIRVANAALAEGDFDDHSFTWISRARDLTGLDYAWIWAASHHLIDEFGEQTFFEFYRDFKNYDQHGVAHPLEDVWGDATHRLLRRIYEMNERELDERTRTWIRRHSPDEWERQQENTSAAANTAG